MSSTIDLSSLPLSLRIIHRILNDPRARLEQIEDLWRSKNLNPNFSHQQSELMEWWTRNEDVSELLDDKERLREIVVELRSKCEVLIMFAKIRGADTELLRRGNVIIVNPSCMFCNNCSDQGGCNHDWSPERLPMCDAEINEVAHEIILMLSVINFLLVKDHLKTTNKLALLFSSKDDEEEDTKPTVALVLDLMDRCSRLFPKISRHAAGTLSLLICTNPALTFSCLDGENFVKSMGNHMDLLFDGVIANCMIENYSAIVACMNILPILYHVAMWNEAKSTQWFDHVMGFFASIVINTCQDVTRDNQLLDPPIDLHKYPEMVLTKVIWEPLLFSRNSDEIQGVSSNENLPRDWRLQLLHNHPRKFFVMAGLEVLGWWSAKGIDLSRCNIRTWTDYDKQNIGVLLSENASRIRLLIRESPHSDRFYNYMDRIVDAIANREKAKRPAAQISLLYGPFYYDSRRCGFCHKTEQEVGNTLLSCTGGCCGLEQYCCKEHQKADWNRHKVWCKKNRSGSS